MEKSTPYIHKYPKAYPDYDQYAFITRKAPATRYESMDERAMEKKQGRLEQLIPYLAEQHNISLGKAMDIYYRSKLADKIHNGVEGVQYLNFKVLAQILLETEPELLE